MMGQGFFQQYAAANIHAISGPTSTGNTSAITQELDSYGNNAATAADVVNFIYDNKFGQNPNWGLIDQMYDFSGRPEQAFGQWMMEGDISGNGQDRVPWDPAYYTPGMLVGEGEGGPAMGRVAFYMNLSTMNRQGWSAGLAAVPYGTAATSRQAATVIAVVASNGVQYDWFCVTGGTTGTTQPTWPSPAEITGTIASGVLTVSSVTSGALAVGDYLSGYGFIGPIGITGQNSGAQGGVGTYTVSGGGAATSATGMYAAPHVTDGTAVWQFGGTYHGTVGSILYTAGDEDIGTVIGGVNPIDNAVIDTTGYSFQGNAAALRMGIGQKIDFTGNQTQAGQNQHTLDYENGVWLFHSPGGKAFKLDDSGDGTFDGTMTAQTIAASGAGTVGGLLTAQGGLAVPNGSVVLPLVAAPADGSVCSTAGQIEISASALSVCTGTKWVQAPLS